MKSRVHRAVLLKVLFNVYALTCNALLTAQEVDVGRKDKLKAELEQMYEADQLVRMQISSYLPAAPPDSLIERAMESDSRHRIRVLAILDSAGWLSENEVGRKASQALFLVILHCDDDVRSQEYYLAMMRQAVADGKSRASELAILEDRVAVNKGEEQIYGSQIGYLKGRAYIEPIRDEAKVEERRRSVGLGSLKEYAAQFGIEWKAPAVVDPAPR